MISAWLITGKLYTRKASVPHTIVALVKSSAFIASPVLHSFSQSAGPVPEPRRPRAPRPATLHCRTFSKQSKSGANRPRAGRIEGGGQERTVYGAETIPGQAGPVLTASCHMVVLQPDGCAPSQVIAPCHPPSPAIHSQALNPCFPAGSV